MDEMSEGKPEMGKKGGKGEKGQGWGRGDCQPGYLGYIDKPGGS